MIETISGQVRAAAMSEIVFRSDLQDPSASPTFLGCAAQSIPMTLIERADSESLAKASPYVDDNYEKSPGALYMNVDRKGRTQNLVVPEMD